MMTPLTFSEYVEMRLQQADRALPKPKPHPPKPKDRKGPVGLSGETPAQRWNKTLQIAWDAGTEMSQKKRCCKS